MRGNLNPSQLEAVSLVEGPALVIAGAGSGKTRVIEYRVLRLVERGIRPDSILLLTFTRRAAGEMLARAAGHNPGCMRVEGGTFHSFAYKWLKKRSDKVDYSPDFSILDEADCAEAISRCCTKLGFSSKTGNFPKKRTLKKVLSASANRSLSVEMVLSSEYPHFVCYAGEIEKLGREYRDFKRAKGYMDYDDLLAFFQALLEQNSGVREEITEKHRYVMVDEYQDTNRMQGEITCLLAGERRNVMVVGDDAQSIYGFRGASHENIMKFPGRFPGCRIIKLEVNYRSTEPVLELANAVLENMENKYSKCLVSERGGHGSRPGITIFENAYREAEWVADRIAGLAEAGVGFGSQGVLFRSSSVSIPLQTELIRRGLRFRVFGGLRFYETSHVKDVLSVLRIMSCRGDEIAWHRGLMLIEGIGAKTAERILSEAAAAPDMESAIRRVGGYTEGYKFSPGLKRFETLLRRAAARETAVADKVGAIIDFYGPVMKKKFDDWPQRARDLAEVGHIAGRYGSAEKFLADFAIDAPGRGETARDDEDALTLSTIHSAKGLEWEAVFFIGLMEGALPVGFALEDEGLIEEERRLFYVGITRARTHLFLTAHLGKSGVWGGAPGGRVSRFVGSPNVLKRLEMLNRAGCFT